jgi:hypothetical protein
MVQVQVNMKSDFLTDPDQAVEFVKEKQVLMHLLLPSGQVNGVYNLPRNRMASSTC